MASAPILGSNHHYHSHSYSYSGSTHLSPGKTSSHSYTKSNGNTSKHSGDAAVGHSPLFTHAESSRETSPVFFPTADHNPYRPSPSLEQSVQAFQQNGRLSNHRYSRSSPVMRSGRPRGESDLGRPANGKSEVYQSELESIPAASSSWFSLPEALTSMLVTFPFLLSSTSYSLTFGPSARAFPPLGAYSIPHLSLINSTNGFDSGVQSRWCAFVNTGILASGTLLAVGITGKIRSAKQASDDPKERSKLLVNFRPILNSAAIRTTGLRIVSVALPFYASMVVGGSRTALVLLVALAADLVSSERAAGYAKSQLGDLWASKVATSVVILLCFMSDETGLTVHASLTDLILGYLALAVSVLVLPLPLPSSILASPSKAGRSRPSSAWTSAIWSGSRSERIPTSRLINSPVDVDITLVGGTLAVFITALAASLTSTPVVFSPLSVTFFTLTIATMAACILVSQPSTLRSHHKAGLALGCLISASCSFLFSPSLWPGTVCNGGLAALAFVGVLYDSDANHSEKDSHDAHDNVHNTNTHHHHRPGGTSSAFTTFILAQCEPGSLVHTILSDKDSRRIAYFTVLNFGFMLVQGAYGYLSGSLGLLSDTVHMLFDCLGLIVGLGAAVASKWPTSPEKPYGWGKLNTLAGFGNGIFLMLVSVEFVWEAIEGILEGRELRHVEELLVVSTLGLLVNLVGLFAFGHAHAGHDHGHGHSHGHSHSHSHSHEKTHDHTHSNGHAHSHECSHHNHQESTTSHSGHHHHHHEHNENMHGIFLHVAADAGGSLAVIISTALTLWKPWYLWDPLATILIAVLIFAAAVPLVTSSGQKLLLVVPDELEYGIKEALQELGELRGVIGYAVPRFWIDDKDEAAGEGDHSGRKKIIGAVHVIASSNADLEDVRERVEAFVADRNMNVTIHVEREADGQCWCGGGGVAHSG